MQRQARQLFGLLGGRQRRGVQRGGLALWTHDAQANHIVAARLSFEQHDGPLTGLKQRQQQRLQRAALASGQDHAEDIAVALDARKRQRQVHRQLQCRRQTLPRRTERVVRTPDQDHFIGGISGRQRRHRVTGQGGLRSPGGSGGRRRRLLAGAQSQEPHRQGRSTRPPPGPSAIAYVEHHPA